MPFKSSLMRFTVSSNVEDSHDALSSTVDCASTSNDKNVISTQITKVKRKADQRASNMLPNCNQIKSNQIKIYFRRQGLMLAVIALLLP